MLLRIIVVDMFLSESIPVKPEIRLTCCISSKESF